MGVVERTVVTGPVGVFFDYALELVDIAALDCFFDLGTDARLDFWVHTVPCQKAQMLV
jgi:hypothetical protein